MGKLSDDLGTMKDVKTSIHVKPGANPVFCKARTVPYLMKTKVDKCTFLPTSRSDFGGNPTP